MTSTWAASLPKNPQMLGSLRATPGLTVGETSTHIWLKGEQLSDTILARLHGIADAEIYHLTTAGQLIPLGLLLPVDSLSQIDFQPLANWCTVDLPGSVLAGLTPSPIKIGLVASSRTQPASALVTDLRQWHDYALSLPQLRLAPLVMAADDRGRAILRGSPLPSVAGSRYVVQDGIGAPVGWSIDPPVAPVVLRELYGLEGDDLILIHAQGWDLIRGMDFVQVTRSALRATVGASHG